MEITQPKTRAAQEERAAFPLPIFIFVQQEENIL